MIEDDTFIVKGLPPLKPIRNVSVGKLIYDNLIANCADNEALIDALTGESISCKQILSKTCSLAESLRRSGYNSNTIFTICSENCLEFLIPVIAVFYIGATIAPINHTHTESELIHALTISKSKVIFCSKQAHLKLAKLKKSLSFIERLLIIDGEDKNEDSLENFIIEYLHSREPLYRFDVAQTELDQMVLILYSSGTTGLPKGVIITQRNILTRFAHSDDPRLFPQEGNRCLLQLLPFFHGFGLFMGLQAIYKSMKLIVLKKFDEKLFLSSIEKYKITSLPLVPPLAVLLSKSPLVDAYDLSSVTHVACGAASLSKETEELLMKRLNVHRIRQGYGLTETTLSVTGFVVNDGKAGSSGIVYPYNFCKLRDPQTGKSLGPDQVGEICVKGEAVMKGYYGNEQATKNAFTKDGWFLTGDLGYYDEDGYFYIVGRLKELIKYKGFQVAPAELEAVLLTHPKIKDAAVIGLPNEEAGELPMAFVVPHPKSNLTEKEVEEFIAKRVSSYKRLRGGVIFTTEIPKNLSGKILRRKLHEMLRTRIKGKL